MTARSARLALGSGAFSGAAIALSLRLIFDGSSGVSLASLLFCLVSNAASLAWLFATAGRRGEEDAS